MLQKDVNKMLFQLLDSQVTRTPCCETMAIIPVSSDNVKVKYSKNKLFIKELYNKIKKIIIISFYIYTLDKAYLRD